MTKSPWKIFLILALGFGLRVWGIGFGLPDLYHADEPALVNHAMAHGTGDLNPHYFKLPAVLNYYLLCLYGGFFFIGRLTGQFASVDDFAFLFFDHPTTFYLMGRLLTGVLFGVLGIYLIYRLGKECISERVGLTAAFFLSAAFLHVRDSHYVIYDIPLTTGMTACLLPLLRLAKRGGLSNYLIFGLLAGLTTGVKYNGALIFLPFFLAHGPRVLKKREAWTKVFFHPHLWAGISAAAAIFFLTNPFILLDFPAFWKDFSIQAGAESHVGLLHHFRYSLNEGLGLALLISGLAGIPLLLISKEITRVILAGFILIWLVYIGFFSQPYERYALPVIPFLCLTAAVTLSWLTTQWEKLSKPFFWGLSSLLLTVQPLAYSVTSDILFTRSDMRTVAKEWIQVRVPGGSKIALDYPFHQPRFRFSKEPLMRKLQETEGAHGGINRWRLALLLKRYDETQPAYQLYFFDEGEEVRRPLFARPTLAFKREALEKEGVEYVLVTRLTKDYEHPDFYDFLQKKGKKIMVFNPYRDPSVGSSKTRLRQAAAVTEGKDLFARERYGDVIEVFQLK